MIIHMEAYSTIGYGMDAEANAAMTPKTDMANPADQFRDNKCPAKKQENNRP